MTRRPKILFVKSRSMTSKIKGTYVSLGILYIATYLRKTLSATVRIINTMWDDDNPLKTVLDGTREFKPDALGISALTAEAFLAHKIAAAVKSENPDLPVIMGGPYPSSDSERALSDLNVDIVIIGEGEETFKELAGVIMKEGPRWKEANILNSIAGIAFRDGENTRITAARPPIEDLDSLPFPDWDLIDYHRFWKLGKCGMATIGHSYYLPIYTSRGCPFNCIYCHQIFGKKFRARSPENVVDEIAQIMRRGVNHIEVLDDISNFDQKRFNRILEIMLERNLHPMMSFPNGIRADLMTEDSIDLLKKVGTGEISIAVETASNRLQKLLDKNLSLERTWNTIEMFAKRKIFTRGFFMLGFPTETEEEIRSTIRYAHKSNLHLALFFTPNPFKNTKLYDMFTDAGKMPSDTRTIDFEYFGSPFNGSEVSEKTYKRLYYWAYAGFHFHPRRMFRILRDRPCKADIPARALGLFSNLVSFRRLKEN